MCIWTQLALHLRRQTHTEPRPTISLRPREDGGFWYDYVLENQPSASQAIVRWYLIVPDPAFVANMILPPSWRHGLVSPTPSNPRAPYYLNPPGYFVNCSADPDGVIGPGKEASFTFGGPAKPGFLRSFYYAGLFEDHTDNMPNSVALEMFPFRTLAGSTQSRVVLGPAFALTTPRAVMATHLRASVEQLVMLRELEADSAFVQEALRVLQAITGATAGAADIRFQTKPVGEWERELLLAIQTDLG
jgi:hypothetical protein